MLLPCLGGNAPGEGANAPEGRMGAIVVIRCSAMAEKNRCSYAIPNVPA